MRDTKIMGVLNITPDSFSDGGHFFQTDKAISRAEQMIDAGADIIDIGGESSRPGSKPISTEEELSRIIPVIVGIQKLNTKARLSIDTNKPEVMSQALSHGVHMINDIMGMSTLESQNVAASHHVDICLMHMQGAPENMQEKPQYTDVVDSVNAFFRERVDALCAKGVEPHRIYLDPGFGFGKTLEHNLKLFRHLPKFNALADSLRCSGILVGVSRKKMIEQLSGKAEPIKRLGGSIAAALCAMRLGASIIRVHDVFETIQAIKVTQKLVNV